MKLIVLCKASPFSDYLIDVLSNRFAVQALVFERINFKNLFQKKINYGLKHKGLFKTIGLCFNGLFSFFINKKFTDCEQMYFSSCLGKNREVPSLEVQDINEKKSVDFIESFHPDIICIVGTSILKRQVICLASSSVLNIHTSLLPKYRGIKSEVWAISKNDFSEVGVTIHVVTEGIDDGAILAQKRLQIEKNDDIYRLRCRNLDNGLNLLVEVLKKYEANQILSLIKQDEKMSSYYSSPSVICFSIARYRLKKYLNSVFI